MIHNNITKKTNADITYQLKIAQMPEYCFIKVLLEYSCFILYTDAKIIIDKRKHKRLSSE